MRMKKIQARDMQEALKLARQDMGDDAIMLQSAKAADGNGIVVTFAIEEDDLPSHEMLADRPEMVQPPAPKPAAPNPLPKSSGKSNPHLVEETLRWHGASKPLQAAVTEAAKALESQHGDSYSLLSGALSQSFKFAPLTGERTPRAIMCVGTPGVGKTFTIAKLATDAIKRKTRLRVITTDTSRAAAYDQLAAFTEILDIPLDLADSRSKLRELLKEHGDDTHVLIDTAGCNPYDFQELKQLGELAKLQDIEPVLVLPLGIDPSEAQEIAGVFSFLDIERLIVTRVDCARRFGGVFAAIETGQFAFSNASASLRVGDGCPALDPHYLTELLLRPARERLS